MRGNDVSPARTGTDRNRTPAVVRPVLAALLAAVLAPAGGARVAPQGAELAPAETASGVDRAVGAGSLPVARSVPVETASGVRRAAGKGLGLPTARSVRAASEVAEVGPAAGERLQLAAARAELAPAGTASGGHAAGNGLRLSSARVVPIALEVAGERVTAADLASVDSRWAALPASTPVVWAPAPGLARELPRSELNRLAARHGLADADGRAATFPVRISRRMRPLEAAEAEAALAASLAARYRIPPEDIAVELVGFRAPRVPAAGVTLRSNAVLGPGAPTVTAPLGWASEGRRSGTVWVRARIEAWGRWAAAARPIAARTPITAADLVWSQGPLPAPPDRWALEPGMVEGQVLARAVVAGERIDRRWVVPAEAVGRGDLVELRWRGPGVELRAPARAEQAGSLGQSIRVRNLASGRNLTARVAGAGVAEVGAGSRR